MVKEITIQELKDLLEKESIQVVDVRSQEKFVLFNLGDQAKHIPLDELTNHFKELDKTKPVYLICNRGFSSLEAAKLLEEQGFEAISVKGGMQAWKESV